MPKLKFRYRILLYLLTIICAALSLVNVVLNNFPFAVGIIFYVCAALTLGASCYYIAINVRHSIKETVIQGIEGNSFTNRVTKDYRYRTVTFAIPGMLVCILYALFNGIIGMVSLSPWFGTLAAYYLLLSVMRIAAFQQNKKVQDQNGNKKRLLEEIALYKSCGILFLFMTIVLMGAVVLLLTSENGKSYPGFTIYAVAAYAFYKIIMSVINVIKTRKMKSPLLMTIRDIGFIDACVSILSLQTAMFAAFGAEDVFFTKMMNGITGSAVCTVVFATGIYEIIAARKMKSKIVE